VKFPLHLQDKHFIQTLGTGSASSGFLPEIFSPFPAMLTGICKYTSSTAHRSHTREEGLSSMSETSVHVNIAAKREKISGKNPDEAEPVPSESCK
jgi:hypothetical protein